MKTVNIFNQTAIKRIILFVFLTLPLSSICKAQEEPNLTPSQWEIEHKKEIVSTNYIFEGIVIKQSKTGQWVCNVIQINKIFKGSPQIKLGTIKVISFGGNISSGGVWTLAKGDTYVVLARTADSSMLVDSIITTNTITLTIMGCDAIAFAHKLIRNGKVIPIKQPAAIWNETKYTTLDSLYSFFKENGLTVQEEADSTKY